MADEATDVNDDLDLGAALLEETSSPTSTEEPSTPEPKETTTAPETPDAEKTDEDSAKDTDTEEPTDDKSDDSEETDTEGQPKKRDAASRKQELQAEIRQLNAQKRQLEEEVKARYEATYRTNTVDELVDEGLEPEEAELKIREQAHELQVEQTRVFNLNQSIDLEVAQVMSDFSWADPESTDYDESTAKLAYERLQEWGKPEVDEKTGFIRNISVMPYQIYEAFDAVRQSSSQAGMVAGQKAQAKMLAAAEPRASAPSAPTEEESDPFLAGFNKVK
jgi:hypothetical protein